MNCQKALGLFHRFEAPHAPFSYTGWLMGKLGAIVSVLRCVVDRIGDHAPVGHTVASQFVRHYLSRFRSMDFQYGFEEALSGRSVTPSLQENIDYFSILIDGAPQIVLDAADLDEDFIDKERIPESLVSTLQTPGIFRPKLVAPQPNRFITDFNSTFSQKIFDIAVTEIESMVEPDGILNDRRWVSVTFVQAG